jgi:biotin carboxyl carrier protein
MSGKVLSINVAVGDKVNAGQLLMIFEAMKMENEFFAEKAGTIAKIHIAAGAALEAGMPVFTIS